MNLKTLIYISLFLSRLFLSFVYSFNLFYSFFNSRTFMQCVLKNLYKTNTKKHGDRESFLLNLNRLRICQNKEERSLFALLILGLSPFFIYEVDRESTFKSSLNLLLQWTLRLFLTSSLCLLQFATLVTRSGDFID